ncbi:MAG TPA: ATP-binding protein [Acidimicrobiales bacterium]|nr:ATP-binding protein [Acidimicrobiales bacterium]
MSSAPPTTDPSTATGDPWREVVGQAAAVRQLVAAAHDPVHAYLLVGPPGSGKRSLARAFAAALLSAPEVADAAPTAADVTDAGSVEAAESDARERHVRLALAGQHPDLRMVEPEGNTFRKGDAERVVRSATLAPVEGRRKVVVADGCQDMEDEAAGYLLKSVEEPPASTVFVLLSTEVVPELVTIASRCVRVDLSALSAEVVADRLVAEGVEPDRAATAAAAAAGDLDRARTLASDDRLALRHQAWREVPRRLDGTGHRAATVVAELQSMIGEALAPLQERQAAEVAQLDEQIEQYGLRGSGRKDLEARHKREVRRFRTAELRFGLATLAAAYRDALVERGARRSYVEALARIDDAAVALQRYPNETLLLQSLMAHLPAVPP